MFTQTSEIRAASSARQLAAYLKTAAESGKKILPLSADRLQCLPDKAKENVILLSLEEHKEILEHSVEDQVILVETGITLASLDAYLAGTKQWLPLSFGSQSETLLQAIVTGDGGALAHGFGGPRHLVLGLTLALSNGTLIRTGGRVVKNVTGYDLTRFMVGSYGIFAVPVAAYLRLYARPERFVSILVSDRDPMRLLAYEKAMTRLGLPLVAVELIDRRLLLPEYAAQVKDEQPHFILMLRLAGAQALVEASLPLLLQVVKDSNQAIERIDEAKLEAGIWSSLARACRTTDAFRLELTINRRTFAGIWQDENWLFGNPFCCGFSLGAGNIFLSRLDEQERAIAALSKYAQNASQPLTIAYSEGQYLRQVKRIGLGSQRQAQLLDHLKKRFDPSNCMNPFVRF